MSNDLNLTKIDDEKRRVFGFGTISVSSQGNQVEDLHEDMIDPEVLEESLYDFVKNCRLAGEMHKGNATGEMIEGICFYPEKTFAMFKDLLGEPLAKFVAERVACRSFFGFEFDDASFQKVKSGEYRMFSIQGTAERVPA